MTYTELQKGIEKNLPTPYRDELWGAIQEGDLSKYTPKQIEKGMLQQDECDEEIEGSGKTLLHEAAENGLLKNIPPALLTSKNLLLHDECNTTCLDFAEEAMEMETIPDLPLQTLIDIQNYYLRRHMAEEEALWGIQASKSHRNPDESDDPNDPNDPNETNTVAILRWTKERIEHTKKRQALKTQEIRRSIKESDHPEL